MTNNTVGMQFNMTPAPESVKEMKQLIMSVLNSNNDQKTKRAAFSLMEQYIKTSGGPVHINDVRVQGPL